VLSSTPLIDAEGRQARRERPPIDAVEVADDGSHLSELWRRRQRFYPQHRPDLLARFVTDALRAADPEAGHRAVARYEMESRVPLVQAQTLVIGHADDPYAFKEMEPLAAALEAPMVTIDGGMVPLEFTAERFARELRSFLSSAHPTSQRPR
jgi:pimeloyl-ACP methyl ester carboxylesterase